MYFFDRDACRVLDDIMGCYENRNFSLIPALVHEAKMIASRVENLSNMKEMYEKYTREIPQLEKNYYDLKNKVRQLKGEVAED